MKKTNNAAIRFFSLPDMMYVRGVKGDDISNDFPRHVHHTFCIGIVEKGKRLISRNKNQIIIPENHLFVINPGIPHACKSFDNQGHSYRILCVRREIMEKIAGQIAEKACYLPYFPHICLADEKLVHMIRYFFSLLRENSPRLERESVLLSVLSELILRYSENAPGMCDVGSQTASVRRVCEYIRQHHAENLSLDELSRIACLSSFHFQRVFVKHIGISPHDYHIQIRIRMARKLLLKGLPITEAAFATGFADQSHFSRFFKKIIGIPPGRYIALNDI